MVDGGEISGNNPATPIHHVVRKTFLRMRCHRSPYRRVAGKVMQRENSMHDLSQSARDRQIGAVAVILLSVHHEFVDFRLKCPLNPICVTRKVNGTSAWRHLIDRKSTRLNSSHLGISYAVF